MLVQIIKTAARTVTYTVNHYIENLENEDYTLKETDNLTAPENTDLTPATKLYTGFTSPEKQTVKVLQQFAGCIRFLHGSELQNINLILMLIFQMVKQTGCCIVKYGVQQRRWCMPEIADFFLL